MKIFNNYSYYYNLFYNNKDYSAEAKIIKELIDKYCEKKVHNILNMGCGTGRHDVELCKLNPEYHIKGIDFSPNMINFATDKHNIEKYNLDYEVADIRTFESDKKYDAVISLFHVMSYQNRNEDLLNAFKSAYNSLMGVGGGINI